MKLVIVNETGHTDMTVTQVEVIDQINDHPTHWIFVDGDMVIRESISDVSWETVDEVRLVPAVVGGRF